MTARVICRSPCPRIEFSGGALAARCRLRGGQIIASCVGNGKCFDETNNIDIERAQGMCWRLPCLPVAILSFAALFHTAIMTLDTRLLKGAKPHDRANGYAVIEIGRLVLIDFSRAIRPSISASRSQYGQPSLIVNGSSCSRENRLIPGKVASWETRRTSAAIVACYELRRDGGCAW